MKVNFKLKICLHYFSIYVKREGETEGRGGGGKEMCLYVDTDQCTERRLKEFC